MPQKPELEIFARHLPEYSVNYCYELWKTFNFNFRITRKRNSKLGDYRFDPTTGQHSISVNHNLNRYAFLITYIHEVAHLTTREKYKNRVLPHGNQWKNEFKKLMIPMLTNQIFPDDVLRVLARHMKNPKASSTSDKNLYLVLRKYDKESGGKLLSELESGVTFLFNKKVYRKIEKRRTRSLCIEVSSNRKYLISETAPVQEFKNQ
ncbi:MAG: transcription elongation protein SprT [Cyclobacteriaceae bacterium]